MALDWLGGEIVFPPRNAWRPLGLEDARRVWAAPPPEGPELYVHFPPQLRLRTDSMLERPGEGGPDFGRPYADCLAREAQALGLPASLRVKTAYLGGGGLGALSTLQPAALERLLGRLAESFDFRESEQFTAEVRPVGLDSARVRLLAAAGVDRVTMVVPDLSANGPELERYLAETARACALCRRAGIGEIDLDLLLGSGERSLAAFPAATEAVLALKPDTVHVLPAFGQDPAAAPDGGRRQEALARARERIARATSGRDNIQLARARKGGRSTLGLGAGAVSHAFARLRYAKAGTLFDYLAALEGGGFPALAGAALDEELEMRAFAAGSLEDIGEVELEAFRLVFGRELNDVFPTETALLLRRGALERRDGVLALTPRFRSRKFEFARLFHRAAGPVL